MQAIRRVVHVALRVVDIEAYLDRPARRLGLAAVPRTGVDVTRPHIGRCRGAGNLPLPMFPRLGNGEVHMVNRRVAGVRGVGTRGKSDDVSL